MQARRSQAVPFAGTWCLLFPVTYIAHIGEELWGGFPRWAGTFSGFAISPEGFLSANIFLWLAMVGAVVWALRSAGSAWVVVALGAIVVVNALLHLLGTFLTQSYSPGLISAAALWLPLGLVTLIRARALLPPRSFRGGVVVGLAVHALVPAVALGFDRLAGA